MSKIGLFFGSFNPVHIGHLIIANTMLQQSDLEEVWFVVSPQNPLKDRCSLLDDHQRLEMVRMAVDDNPRLHVSDVEFSLPLPSYTFNTLSHLAQQQPQHEFCLIMGSDNLANFTRWRNWEQIIGNYQIYVYPRPGSNQCELSAHAHVTMVDVPMLDISSTYIRQQISAGRDVRYLLPEPIYMYLSQMHFYQD